MKTPLNTDQSASGSHARAEPVGQRQADPAVGQSHRRCRDIKGGLREGTWQHGIGAHHRKGAELAI
jgi:hypothetical protein